MIPAGTVVNPDKTIILTLSAATTCKVDSAGNMRTPRPETGHTEVGLHSTTTNTTSVYSKHLLWYSLAPRRTVSKKDSYVSNTYMYSS